MPPIDVFVLTYCRNVELLYGTTLLFKTLRVGFPNARVTVADNASLPEARAEIAQLARETECAFEPIDGPGIQHYEFIESKIWQTSVGAGQKRRTVFLDPDICLWQSCEDLEFDGLIAGTLVSAHDDPVFKCVAMPRLHSSFLWIPDANRLRETIRMIQTIHIEFRPFAPVSVKLGDVWMRYDTGASLYAAIPEQVNEFSDTHRHRYDHLYCGTHYDLWEPHFTGELRAVMDSVHQHAKTGDLAALQGVWREQSRAWSRAFTPLAGTDEVSE
jgi:hypothetical protein